MTVQSHYGLSADDCLRKLQTWQRQRQREQLVSFQVKQRTTHFWVEAIFKERNA